VRIELDAGDEGSSATAQGILAILIWGGLADWVMKDGGPHERGRSGTPYRHGPDGATSTPTKLLKMIMGRGAL
jgi:hypothetical protein